jgi:predicted small lipoprotein YifL
MPSGSYCHNKWVAAFLLVLAGSNFLLNGCGQKGPPRLPRRPLPPAIKDLAFSVHDGMVELTWTVAIPAGRSASSAAAVKVFRSRVSAEEGGCKNCPIRYTVAGDIPIQKKRSDKSEPIRMRYTEFVEPGYRYIFKVIVYDEDGNGGKDSNVVKFDH